MDNMTVDDNTAVVARSSPPVPWQIWVVVVLLGLEGVGNALAIATMPAAATWLAAKCLFIVGLVRGWRWVFVLFLLIGGYHVLVFSMLAQFVALLNLVTVLLVASAQGYFFRGAGRDDSAPVAKPQVVRVRDEDFDF